MPTAAKEVPASLAARLARIADAIGDQEPKRHSRDIKFPYHSARDVYGWWRTLLHAEGIVLVPNVRTCDVQMATLPRSGGGTRTTFLTTLVVDFTLMDGNGEVVAGSAVGQGEDPSDKGAGKAMTYAEKAFLLGLGMNGSESDNEVFADYAYPEEARPARVVIEDSDIEGIERGGRSTMATEVQVRRIRDLARSIDYGVDKTVSLVVDVLGIEAPDLPGDPDDRGPAFVRFLEGLPADDAGRLIQYMEGMQGPPDVGY